MRTPLVAANWKMNKTVAEARQFARRFREVHPGGPVTAAICPPFTALAAVAEELVGTGIALGAQDMHWEAAGAYTGEVSPGMLVELGVTYVIIGHSERRQWFGEDDAAVNRKLKAALNAGLYPILCVGEGIADRRGGRAMEVVAAQLRAGLQGLAPEAFSRTAVAYEPIWAIGTGEAARAEDAAAMAAAIRAVVTGLAGEEAGASLVIQYGGSVKAGNAREFFALEDVDGALVGGAGLDPDSFAAIVAAAGVD